MCHVLCHECCWWGTSQTTLTRPHHSLRLTAAAGTCPLGMGPGTQADLVVHAGCGAAGVYDAALSTVITGESGAWDHEAMPRARQQVC